MVLFFRLVFGSHFILSSLFVLNNPVLATSLNKIIVSRLEEKAHKFCCATPTEIAQITRESISLDTVSILERKVLSVDELKDIQTTDWAFEALHSLINRYSIKSYSDKTFQEK